MRQGRRPEARIVASALVLLVHALLLLAWMRGNRLEPSRGDTSAQIVSLWPEEPTRETPPASPATPHRARAQAAIRRPSVALMNRAAVADTPAVELPAPSDAPGVDWAHEAALAARRHVQAAPPRTTFTEPLPEPRAPCRVKPWKWKPEEKRAGLAPLPYS